MANFYLLTYSLTGGTGLQDCSILAIVSEPGGGGGCIIKNLKVQPINPEKILKSRPTKPNRRQSRPITPEKV